MNPRNRTRRSNNETTTASSAARAAAATSDDDDASSERKSGCGKGHVFSPLPPLFFSFGVALFFEENFCVFSLDFERNLKVKLKTKKVPTLSKSQKSSADRRRALPARTFRSLLSSVSLSVSSSSSRSSSFAWRVSRKTPKKKNSPKNSSFFATWQ